MADEIAASQDRNAPFVRATLLNVADAIHNVLMPDLSGGAKARAAECVTILTRIAQITSPSPVSSAEGIANLAEAEGARLDSVEAEVLEIEGKIRSGNASNSTRSFDQNRFEQYLKAHELGGPEVKITHSRQLAGGRSKQTILVSQEGAKSLPAQLVVRQDWASAVTGTTVVSEYELLRRIWQAGLRVPQPLLIEKSPDALGAPFLVVTRIDGGPKGDIFNPPPSEKLALQVADQLGRLHAYPVEDFERLDVPTEAYTPEQLRKGLDGFRALHAQLGLPSKTIDLAIDWLGRNLDRVDGPRVMAHNDLGCHNFLISEDDDLTAILDWELAHIGNPAADLGYIRSWIGKMTAWETFMAAYQAAGGPAVSRTTLDFYTLWCGVRLYSLLIQARAGVTMGAVRDTEITYACAQFLPQLVHRLSQELRMILKG